MPTNSLPTKPLEERIGDSFDICNIQRNLPYKLALEGILAVLGCTALEFKRTLPSMSPR